MKLTLLESGGFTGLTREGSIELTSLDDSTRKALMKYMEASGRKAPSNLNESWMFDDGKEVPINESKMTGELRTLYQKMKKNLSYPNK